jgi:hypothetical protein
MLVVKKDDHRWSLFMSIQITSLVSRLNYFNGGKKIGNFYLMAYMVLMISSKGGGTHLCEMTDVLPLDEIIGVCVYFGNLIHFAIQGA